MTFMKWKHIPVSEASEATDSEHVIAESLHRGGKLIRMSYILLLSFIIRPLLLSGH